MSFPFRPFLLTLGLLLACLCLFVSCKPQTKGFVIGVSQCSDDDWRNKMNLEMQHEALLYQGVTLDIKTVVDDTEKQIRDIESFIEQKVDLIIVSPNKAVPITPVVEKAYKSGIPVVLVDRKILSDQYTAFIGADNYQIGQEVGNYIANLLKGKGNVVQIRGLEGSTPAFERHQGFSSVISNYPNVKLVYDADGAWLKDVAENKMEEALATCSEIDLVFAQNDRMAIGAYNVAKRQNRSDSIFFLGIDALPGNEGGIEQVLKGKLKATFIYPTGGDKIIDLAMNILQNKPYEKNNSLYTAVVDRSNAQIMKLQSDKITEQESKINFLNDRVNTYFIQYTTQRYLLLSAALIVVLSISFLVFLFFAYRSKNRLNLKLEGRNHEVSEQKNLLEVQRDQLIDLSRQLEEATHAKLVFFTNISHEFRTPLSLIAGPISTLLENESISQEQRRLLSLSQKNIKILLKLIDQIIDFRKYENGKLSLRLGLYDLKQQVVEWNEPFLEIAKKKRIGMMFTVEPHEDYSAIVDVEKIERIYLNLLSNAFKFTQEKGVIRSSLDKQNIDGEDYVVLEVSNSGKGISEEDIRHIFERFYQVDSHFAGSGIGLALVKALVDLHEGKVDVKSEAGGLTTFTVMIPCRKLSENNIYTIDAANEITLFRPEEELYNADRNRIFEESKDANKHTMLVVDDNPDIRSYIKTFMQKQYVVLEANDGEEGLKKAVKYVPDIIVSDIMMPKMDGIELCRQLKDELSTSHIPVILLTACSLDEQRIVGFKEGADDYIVKPFNSAVLETRVENLIESRKQLKERYQKNLFSAETKPDLDDIEKTFLEKLQSEIESNIANSNLNVEELGQRFGLSRTQFYRKVKSLTSYSPNELLRIIRLKRAYYLLAATDLSISEVSYDVGFSSPSYFTKCFKEYYDENPTDYLKRVR